MEFSTLNGRGEQEHSRYGIENGFYKGRKEENYKAVRETIMLVYKIELGSVKRNV